MATLPVYLNALTGKGVHLITVNDYLARRDAEWMARLYNYLGLTVGVNVPGLSREEKQAAYNADITYGTNNEFGFDYLRDNMVYETGDRVQRGLNFAIVDEVDSILIDEARTPLIISGQAEDHTEMYVRINAVVPALKRQIGEADPRTGEGVIEPGDFTVDEKAPPGHADRGRPRARRGTAGAGRAAGRGREPVRPGQHHADAPRVRGAAREPPVPPRPALRRGQRRSDHRRRVHRPPDDGPPLVGRPAPGRRGQGRRRDPEREPDARLDHVPELLPHVHQARWHDGHGRHRGLRVPGDLRPRDRGDPAEPPDAAQGRPRPGLQDRAREVPGGRRGHPRLRQPRPAGAGGHHVDRELRAAVGPAAEGADPAPGAQRQAARARGADRRAGRPSGRDHHRHQHGRPRHRHRAGRQRREADRAHRGRRVDPGRREGARRSRSSRTSGRRSTRR